MEVKKSTQLIAVFYLGFIFVLLSFGAIILDINFFLLLFIMQSPLIFICSAVLIAPFYNIKKICLKVKYGSSRDIDFLIDIVINKKRFSNYVLKCLLDLQSNDNIDLFCEKWMDTRSILLTDILVKSKYIATQPNKNRILTALKVNKVENCINQNYHLVKNLLEAFEDQDLEIAKRAKEYALNLSNQPAIDELFYLFVEENNQIAYQCIQQAQYQSTNIKYKVLFHFLRDEWDAYNNLDFDQEILQELYQSSLLQLRKIIVEKARKRGWIGWLKVIQTNREKTTIEEWNITISILKNNQEFTKMWQLVKKSPIWVSQKLLIELSQTSHQIFLENNNVYQQLLLLANQCKEIKIYELNAENKNNFLSYDEICYKEIISNKEFLITSNNEDIEKSKITNSQLIFEATRDYKEIGLKKQFDIVSDNKNTKVWRIADGQLLLSVEGSYKAISPDGQLLITGDNYEHNRHYRNINKWTKVWRIADGQLIFEATGYYKEISPDWQFLITNLYSSDDNCSDPKVWRIADGKLLLSAYAEYITISPDWQFLFTGKRYSKYHDTYDWPKVWRIADGQLIFEATGYNKEISPDWQFLITSDNGDTKVWRIADGQLLLSTEQSYREISSDWQFLVTAKKKDGFLCNLHPKVWRVADGQLIFEATGYYKEISPDWQFLITSDGDTKVWRIADGQLLLSTYEEYKTISSDWQFLITSNNVNTKVWRIADGQLLLSAEGSYREISSDWQFLITVKEQYGSFYNPKVWRIADGKLLLSTYEEYKTISPDWQFLITSDNNNKKKWKIDLANIKFYFYKFVDQLTIQDMEFFQNMRRNQISNYLNSIITDEQKNWLDFMIKLAEYKLSFDVEISDDISINKINEFDIEIE